MKLIWSDENSIQALRNHESALLKFNHVNKIHLSIKGCFLSIFYLGLALSAQNHLHGILRFVIDYQWNLLLPVFFYRVTFRFIMFGCFFFQMPRFDPAGSDGRAIEACGCGNNQIPRKTKQNKTGECSVKMSDTSTCLTR